MSLEYQKRIRNSRRIKYPIFIYHILSNFHYSLTKSKNPMNEIINVQSRNTWNHCMINEKIKMLSITWRIIDIHFNIKCKNKANTEVVLTVI